MVHCTDCRRWENEARECTGSRVDLEIQTVTDSAAQQSYEGTTIGRKMSCSFESFGC